MKFICMNSILDKQYDFLYIEYKVFNWILQGFFKADQQHSLQIHTLVGFKEMTVKLRDIITIEPGKRGGKPCIRGMRITIYDVLDYLASGMSHEEILNDFPYLTEEDILACLKFASEREYYMMAVAA